MRIIQAIAILVGVLAGVFLLGGQLLPSKMVVERNGELCHAPEAVYQALSTPARIARWSLFSRKADIPVTHSDTAGEGGWVRWTGNEGDVVEWRIESAEPDEAVEYRIDLDREMTVSASGRLEILADDRTRLTMSLGIEPQTIAGRWGMMLMVWLPGGQSLKDVLGEEIKNLRDYLGETEGECAAQGA